MDINGLAKKIESSVSGAILEKGSFGRPPIVALWIEAAKIREVLAWIKNETGPEKCALEDLCVAQVEQALLVSYFLEFAPEEGENVRKHCVLRVSLEVPHPESRPEVPSVAEEWPVAQPLEAYLGEMFGIAFTNGPKPISLPVMPEGWLGYPLHKTYVFPREFFGISHGGVEEPRA